MLNPFALRLGLDGEFLQEPSVFQPRSRPLLSCASDRAGVPEMIGEADSGWASCIIFERNRQDGGKDRSISRVEIDDARARIGAADRIIAKEIEHWSISGSRRAKIELSARGLSRAGLSASRYRSRSQTLRRC